MKDMVTTVDPTSKFSFLQFLHDEEMLWHFLNQKTLLVRRQEFQNYLEWIIKRLKNIHFNTHITDIKYSNHGFEVIAGNTSKRFLGKNLSIGVGNTPSIPSCLDLFCSEKVFHSSKYMFNKPDKLNNLRLLIIGGGQSGAEIFLNLLDSVTPTNCPDSIIWISERMSFFQLDENPLAEIIYSSHFASKFAKFAPVLKEKIRESCIYTANGISEMTTQKIYDKMYKLKFIDKAKTHMVINAGAKLVKVNQTANGYQTNITLCDVHHYSFECDYIICATGYKQRTPVILDSLMPHIQKQEDNNVLKKTYH